MAKTALKTGTKIQELFTKKPPASKAMHSRAASVLPGGVEHDNRIHKPFPLYIERAQGSRKWDLDGNEYVDYVSGHGALLLGHNHPVVTEAVRKQLERGTHLGASHAEMVEWADRVCDLVPCAEMVRFHSSGTEATLMAIRMCRAVTGRDKCLKFHGHFHGWHDYATVGVTEPYDTPTSAGG